MVGGAHAEFVWGEGGARGGDCGQGCEGSLWGVEVLEGEQGMETGVHASLQVREGCSRRTFQLQGRAMGHGSVVQGAGLFLAGA